MAIFLGILTQHFQTNPYIANIHIRMLHCIQNGLAWSGQSISTTIPLASGAGMAPKFAENTKIYQEREDLKAERGTIQVPSGELT